MRLSRILSLAIVGAAIAIAQPTTTTVTDTLRLANGSTFCGGTITLTWPTFTSMDGYRIQGGSLPVPVDPSTGVFSVNLIPTNTTTTPNQGFYTVRYDLRPTICTAATSAWKVPATGPVGLTGVETVAIPPPPQIPLNSLQSPASPGTYAICFLNGYAQWSQSCAATGGGTVTTFSAGNLSPLFATSVANPTTTPALTFTLNSQTQNRFFASPNGSTGTPTFRAIALADLPALTSGSSILYGNGSGGFSNVTLGSGLSFSGGTLSATGGTGTVTTFSAGNLSPLFTTSVATATTTPALTFSLSSQSQNLFFASPNGSSGTPTFRAIAATDLPSLTSGSNILYGNGSGGFSNVTLGTGLSFSGGTLSNTVTTSGTSILYGNGSGGFSNVTLGSGLSFSGGTLSATGGTGTVTTFSAGNLSPLFTTSVATATTTPALTFTLSNATANTIFAGPSSGSAAAPTFRALVGADLPTPTGSTLGGVQSYSAVSHQWLTSLANSGVFSSLQPAFSDLSGSATCSQLPALAGDTTTSAGSCATTTSKINGTAFAGTTGDVVTFGASNTPSDSGKAIANLAKRAIGAGFDGSGSALTSGSTQTTYFTVPFACTITAWNITVDTGTITFDIWKIATGTAIPTSSNSITASALPAISTGTALHSTTLTGWTTSVAANDIVAININTVSSATKASLIVECDQ